MLRFGAGTGARGAFVAVLCLLAGGIAGAGDTWGGGGLTAAQVSARSPSVRATQSSREWFGTVLAQSDLAPVAGVRIAVEPVPEGGLLAELDATPRSTAGISTDANGDFVLEAPPQRRLRLSAPGFLDGFVLLHGGRDSDLGRLILRHELSLSGRVLLDGRPAADVTLIAPAYRRQSFAATPAPEAISSTDGHFRIGGLRPEQFRELVFIAHGIAEARELAGLGTPLDPRHYELGDIELLSRRPLRGTVIDANGAPVPDAIVWVSSSDTMRLEQTWNETGSEERFRPVAVQSDDAGQFSLPVVAGSHGLTAFHEIAGRGRMRISIEASADEPAQVRLAIEPHRVVRGRVLDGAGNPLAGAEVRPLRDDQTPPGMQPPADFLRAVTDAEGCYAARGLRGFATVEVDLAEYATRRVTLEIPAQGSASSTAGACSGVPPIVLEPGARLEGRVVDQLGAPVVGATVSPDRHQDAGGYFGPAPRSSPVTRLDGHFELEGLAFGDYSLSVQAAGHVRAFIDNLPIGPLPTDPAGASPRRLGDVRLTRRPDAAVYSIEVTLERVLPVTFHEVVVFDARGVPEPEAEVESSRRNEAGEPWGPSPAPIFTGADGRGAFAEMPLGTYETRARAPSYHHYGSARLDHSVEAAGNPSILTMPPHPPLGELHGRYVDDDGRGIPQAAILASGSYRQRREARTVTEADGSFRLVGLPYGTYLLRAEHPRLPPVVHPVTVELEGSSMGPVAIALPSFGAIEGVVSGMWPDERGGVAVRASMEIEIEQGPRHFISVPADVTAEGRFRLDALMPGSWELYATGRGGRRARTMVRVPPGESISGIDLAFPMGFTVTGTITWRGEPPDRAWITAGDVRALELPDPTVFELRDVPPGEQQLWIGGETGLHSPYFVYARIESDTHLDIVIEGGAVRGRVIDAETGEPIVGAYVGSDPVPQLVYDGHAASRRTDRNGAFSAGPFPAGRWRFEVSASGYERRAPEIDIGAVDIDDYVIELQPTRDLQIRLLGPPELDASRLHATWYDLATGEAVSVPSLALANGPSGVVWRDAPTGRGVLQVTSARQDLAARIELDSQDGLVDLRLEPTGSLAVVVPDFVDHPPIFAVLRVFDAQGRLVPNGYASTSHRTFFGRDGGNYELPHLVPGRYRIDVETSDGRSLAGEAEVRPREDVEVVLR